MTIADYTENFNLPLPEFDTATWHDAVYTCFRVLDAVLAKYAALPNIQGTWANSTAYTVGQVLCDPTDGTLWTVAVGHTSVASPTTFAATRLANPTYWTNATFPARNKGGWTDATAYIVGDIVSSGQSVYICIIPHTSSGSIDTTKFNVLFTGTVVSLPTINGIIDAAKAIQVNALGTGYELSTAIGALAYLASVGTSQIDNDAVTYAKMQDVSATDMLLGRSTAGAGNVEEIACTAAGRALLDDADAAAMRTTLGLAIGTNVLAYSTKIQNLANLTWAADNFAYMTSATATSKTALTAFARTLLDDADAATVLTTLGVSAFAQTLLDDAAAGNVLTTLGVSSFAQTVLDDTTAPLARATLGAIGNVLGVQTFTAGATYTRAANVVAAIIIVTGASGGGADADGVDGTAGGTTAFGTHISITGGAAATLGTIDFDGTARAADGVVTGGGIVIGWQPGGLGGYGYDGGGAWRIGQAGGNAPIILKYITPGSSETVTIGAAGAGGTTGEDGMAGKAGQIVVIELG